MPTSTYTALATTTLANNTAQITFASIPSSFRDLVLIINGGIVDGSFAGKININGDSTTANYTRASVRGSGTTISSNSIGSAIRWDSTAAENGIVILNFMDYSSNTNHKNVLIEAGGVDVEANISRYASTDVITSIKVFYDTNMKTGMTLSLYGISG